ncbi:sigma-54 dependent transcriptional regulator [Aquabacterium sp. CECT 9606]|uniref:sigma-54-dependent transcriptional regulator n=1 Tax=Aquabacterium sp. CECT 9606 TaxID=2845822 RepID=UPI001E49123A|nr:sigma-54 dependent transcriptional regulator [Aquabacterium sp. CECT 9606]CAH0354441.1 C4-dicarboxylate transport transcriptional regulatory protein DctD [Aquabacterium sp. CECT 9606]
MSTEFTILIVEDDPNVRLGCVQAMQLAGLAVEAVASAEEALPHVTAGQVGVVVTDMRLPKADGLSLIRLCQQFDPSLPAIMITGHGDVTLAVDAMRSGAYDFITKPFSPEVLVDVVRRALEKRLLTSEVAKLRQQLAHRTGIEGKLIGQSDAMKRVRQLVLDVAESPVDILIRGETGCGKELVAQALHDFSHRRDAPYVALNCGGMPDNLLDSELFGHEAGAFTGAQKRRIGKIEHAQGGTLFLDEVESMPMNMQIKLLRVLQERKLERLGSNQSIDVDCRVVAASKDDLLARAQDKTFRLDLYYRLNVVCIELPPLRERREDIPMLMTHFTLLAAQRFNRPQPELSAALMSKLMAYAWPGNVRELRNVADCLVLGVRNGVVDVADTAGAASQSLSEAVDQFERAMINAELQRHGGNVARCAEALNIAKTTLHDKIKRHGL